MKQKICLGLIIVIPFFIAISACASHDKEQNAIPFVYDENEEIGFFRESAVNENRIIIER